MLTEVLANDDHLSACLYSTAIHALYPSPSQDEDIAFLLSHRNPDGTWGSPLSWQEMYLATYASCLAFLQIGDLSKGHTALSALAALPVRGESNRTLNFGGLIDVLDKYAQAKFGLFVPHPLPVIQQSVKEANKWKAISSHGEFYNPSVSIAGFFGEVCYVNPEIDLKRFLSAFQIENGSITASPAASTMLLIACEERGMGELPDVQKLRQYVMSLKPPIAFLDSMSHQIATWILLYMDPDVDGYVPDVVATQTLCDAISDNQLVCSGGNITLPGDLDTTACAVLGLRLEQPERARMLQVAQTLWAGDHYLTVAYENTASTTTNIHVAAAWPENPHLDETLDWLLAQRQDGFLTCKWHSSPYYALTEAARLLCDSPSEKAQRLAIESGSLILSVQNSSGGWGLGDTTVEETAYAVLALDKLARRGMINVDQAHASMHRAQEILMDTSEEYPSIWIGKGLYCMKPFSQYIHHLAQQRSMAASRILASTA